MKKPKRKPRKPHTDTRNLLRHPEKIPGALAAITPVEPPESAVAAFRALVDTVGRVEGDKPAGGHSGAPGGGGGSAGDAGSAGVTLAAGLPRANCICLLGMLISGAPYAAALEAAGLSWAQVYLCEKWDPDGFARLLAAAGQLRDSIFKARARDALMQRAVDGVAEPIVGRIGRDLDGQLTGPDGRPLVKRRYSDQLLEFGLARLDRATFAEPARGAAQINVGHQVVYNIQGLPMQGTKPPIEAEAVETVEIPAETGTTTAALPDIDD